MIPQGGYTREAHHLRRYFMSVFSRFFSKIFGTKTTPSKALSRTTTRSKGVHLTASRSPRSSFSNSNRGYAASSDTHDLTNALLLQQLQSSHFETASHRTPRCDTGEAVGRGDSSSNYHCEGTTYASPADPAPSCSTSSDTGTFYGSTSDSGGSDFGNSCSSSSFD